MTILRTRRGLVLLQGGQGFLVSTPSVVKPRVCVIHRCERAGDIERTMRLGGNDIAVLVCSRHTDVEAGQQSPQPQTGS